MSSTTSATSTTMAANSVKNSGGNVNIGFSLPIPKEEIQQFQKDGFVIKRGLFSPQEVEVMKHAAEKNKKLHDHVQSVGDSTGKNVKLVGWNHPGNDVFGMISRCHKVVDRMEAFLDDEVYHYHSKIILKDAHEGGSFVWHQDYGYWYYNGALFPNLASVFIAIDEATTENGCLQVIRGSHHAGRIDHGLVGGQTGAQLERVHELAKTLETVDCVMKPGDAIFFHCNVLHRSGENNSDKRRWALICCYNTKSNNPYKEHHHPRYTPLTKVQDSKVLEVGMQQQQHSDSTQTVGENDDSVQFWKEDAKAEYGTQKDLPRYDEKNTL